MTDLVDIFHFLIDLSLELEKRTLLVVEYAKDSTPSICGGTRVTEGFTFPCTPPETSYT